MRGRKRVLSSSRTAKMRMSRMNQMGCSWRTSLSSISRSRNEEKERKKEVETPRRVVISDSRVTWSTLMEMSMKKKKRM